jgi:hypothetical protein
MIKKADREVAMDFMLHCERRAPKVRLRPNLHSSVILTPVRC